MYIKIIILILLFILLEQPFIIYIFTKYLLNILSKKYVPVDVII